MRIIYVPLEGFESTIENELKSLGHSVELANRSLSSIDIAPDAIFLELSPIEGVPQAVSYWREQGAVIVGVFKEPVPAFILEMIDDFMMGDIAAPEIELRLDFAMMRSGKLSKDIIKVDGMVINVANYEATVDGHAIDLTYKEFELLKFLAINRGRVVTRDVLLDRVWGYDYFGGTRTVDVHVRRLRAKLGRLESLVETVRNVGYRFKK